MPTAGITSLPPLPVIEPSWLLRRAMPALSVITSLFSSVMVLRSEASCASLVMISAFRRAIPSMATVAWESALKVLYLSWKAFMSFSALRRSCFTTSSRFSRKMRSAPALERLSSTLRRPNSSTKVLANCAAFWGSLLSASILMMPSLPALNLTAASSIFLVSSMVLALNSFWRFSRLMTASATERLLRMPI